MEPRVNYLLSLHHEMDKFEALYFELHTHLATRIPESFGTGWMLNPVHGTMTSDVLAYEICRDTVNGELEREDGNAWFDSSESDYPNRETENEKNDDGQGAYGFISRKGSGSMTNLFVEDVDSPQETIEKPLQEMWVYLTNISLIFNRMRYFLVSNEHVLHHGL